MSSRDIKATIKRYIWIRDTLLSGLFLNCTEIAAKLDMSTKTASRYIRLLRWEGYKIEYDAKLRGFVIRGKNDRKRGAKIPRVQTGQYQKKSGEKDA